MLNAQALPGSAYDFFTLSSASSVRNSGGQSINNRVADDLAVNYTYNGNAVLKGKPDAESKLYTLESRASILKDWDLSNPLRDSADRSKAGR